MNISIKKPEELKTLAVGGKLLAGILRQLVAAAQAGVTTASLDAMAERLIRECGGEPAFKGYRTSRHEPPFPSTICASVNEQLVHTPASDYVLKIGDIISLDIGMKYPAGPAGLFTDMATTIPIGPIDRATKELLKVTQKSLALGIAQAKPGNRVSHISAAIQGYIDQYRFGIVRELAGHGVGYAVHEEPRIPNFVDRRISDPVLQAGMVIAIEPMVALGSPEIITLDDEWTIAMADGSRCAHFEHTVIVTNNGAQIITS